MKVFVTPVLRNRSYRFVRDGWLPPAIRLYTRYAPISTKIAGLAEPGQRD